MEDDGEHYEYYILLKKCESTVDGLLASGRSNIWSTYGGLRRAQEVLLQSLCHGLRNGMEKKIVCYLTRQRNDSSQPEETTVNLEKPEPVDLGQFLEECLLGYYTSDLLSTCFSTSNDSVIDEMYEGNAFVKKRNCVDLLAVCFRALEQNSLEILASASQRLANEKSFMEYFFAKTDALEEHKKIETEKLDNTILKSVMLEHDQYFYDTRTEDINNLKYHAHCCDNGNEASSENQERLNKSKKSEKKILLKKQGLHQEVLLTCALSAVMEANEDGVAWFDDDERSSLVLEPDDIARNRISRMREISRSESSLYDEHGHVDVKDYTSPDGYTEVIHSLKQAQPISSTDDKQYRDVAQLESNNASSLLKRSNETVISPFKKGHNRSKSDQIGLPNLIDVTADENRTKDQPLSTSAPTKQFEMYHQDYYYQPEDGYMFPKPYKGQSLISYLDSRSYDTGADLDKENAHFSICEALIAAIEQMKCSRFFDTDSDDSDEEIKQLKCKIKERRIRKRQQKYEMQRRSSSDRSASTSQSTSSFFSGSTFSSSFSSSPTDESTAQEITSQKALSRSWENVSINPTQNKHIKEAKYEHSQSDLVKLEECTNEDNCKPDDYSAEFVAKSLLRKFNGRKLPAASDLKWMVTEEQVPQTLLPLPNAWPVSPDDAIYIDQVTTNAEENNVVNTQLNSNPTRLRGNFEWAPPRPQIIFSPHPYIKRKHLLQKQHYRCTGCGLKVTPSLSKRFRYCEYLGKYFCTSCHQNRLFILPSKIISKWDFKLYPVSDFAFEFLKKIKSEPLFDICAIDKAMYKKIKALEMTKDLRLKLHYAKRFLKACRHGQRVFGELENLPAHITDEIDIYSLDDFKKIKSCELQGLLKTLVNNSVRHINDCQLCRVKGFVCEYCRDGDDILYPFELKKVATCTHCRACYHKSCFVADKCPRCERLRARKRLLDTKYRETDQQN